MFIIGEAVVDEAVTRASFCCDVEICRGACCTLAGARGAPLEDNETQEIEKAYPFVKPFLSIKSTRTIERDGLYEGTPGNFATTCVDDRECVFVYFERGIARCGFERAYLEGRTSWRKPLSCHLFPIRIRGGSNDRLPSEALHYEQLEECSGGRERGARENIPLLDFLREPLIRKYGSQWYEKSRNLLKGKVL